MLRQETFIESDRCASTPDEKWTLERPAQARLQYGAAADFATQRLGEGKGRTCLVVGSPIFEALMLEVLGWDVTYLDVRTPPVALKKFILCDATKMTLPDESFDAVSTSCVLCHAGMGRYGDALVENGDEVMLAHLHRVMKPGAPAAIMFGNVAAMSEMVRLGTCHRIYTVAAVRRMLSEFETEEMAFWRHRGWGAWFTDEKDVSDDYMGRPDYLSVFVRRPC